MSDFVTLGLILTALVILAVVVALLFARAPQRHRPAEGAAAALLALAQGERVRARKLLVDAVDRGENGIEALLVLGLLLREEGDDARALHVHHSILARPTLTPEHRRLAELQIADDLLAAGRNETAEKRLAALDEHFVDGSLLERRAVAQLRTADRAGAVDTWVRRARIDRDDARAQARAADAVGEIARTEAREGRLETAVRYARKALDIDARRPVAHLVLGDAAQAQGRPDEALKRWQEGLRASPGGATLLLGRLLEVSLQKGRLDGLVETIDALREARPDDVPLWRAAADLRLRRGDRESFFALLEDPPTVTAATVESWAGWIRHLQSRGDEPDLRRVLAAMPDAFGPTSWRCPACGAGESEPRLACAVCGEVTELRPVGGSPLGSVARLNRG